MDQQDVLFTQAVVGGPMRIRLGVPVGPTNHTKSAPASQATGIVPKARLRVPVPAWLVTRHAAMAGAACISVATLGLAAWQWAPWKAVTSSPVAAATLEAPKPAASAPEAADARLPIMSASEVRGILPAEVAAGAVSIDSGAFTPKRHPDPAPAPAGPLVAAQPPATRSDAGAKAKPDAQEKSSLVIDATAKPADKASAAPPPPPPAPQAAAAVPASPAPVKAAPAGKLVGPAVEKSGSAQVSPAVATQEGRPKVNVVAIDPTSAFALITNPGTRLPEKFSVGQKLFTGETIKRIDAAAGRVETDARTISMQ